MERGNIVITPWDQKLLNPNSVDLTLAPSFKIYIRDRVTVDNISKVPNWVVDNGLEVTMHEDGRVSYIEPLDVRKDNPSIEIKMSEEGIVLLPNRLYLYACNERIGVKKDICGTVMGKSSLGRLGLDIHVCAGFVDTGFEGSLVLEMRVVEPLRIYPNMKICQVKFERVEGEILEPYDIKPGSKYAGQVGVQTSLMHKNFEEPKS